MRMYLMRVRFAWRWYRSPGGRRLFFRALWPWGHVYGKPFMDNFGIRAEDVRRRVEELRRGDDDRHE